MGNFVKIDRKIIEWEWWDDFNTFRLFFYMLVSAYWKDGYYKGELIERGSFPSSISKLASETGLTDNEIRNALKHLKSTGEITSKAHSKYSVFTIKNYNLYQSDNKQKCDETTSTDAIKMQSDNEQITNLPIIKEVKNIRSKEYKNNIGAKTTHYDDPDLNSAFAEFLDMRKKIKKPIATKQALTRMKNKIERLSGGDTRLAIKILNQSVDHCWSDVYGLKNDYSSRHISEDAKSKSVTDMQLASLEERQKQSVPIMSDEEINKMFEEE